MQSTIQSLLQDINIVLLKYIDHQIATSIAEWPFINLVYFTDPLYIVALQTVDEYYPTTI